MFALTLESEEASLGGWLCTQTRAFQEKLRDLTSWRDGDARTKRANNPSLDPFPSCKQVALQQAEACLKSINKDMMSDGQSSAGKNGITCVTTSVLNNNTLHNDMKGFQPKC